MDRVNYSKYLFTDKVKKREGGWLVRSLVGAGADTPALANRWHKFHPHLMPINSKVAIYIDGNIEVVGDISPLVEKFMASGSPVGLIRHPFRSSIYEELGACIALRKLTPEGVKNARERMRKYRIEGFPDEHVLTENNVIFFNLDCSDVAEIGDLVWREMAEGVPRDQLCMPYAVWKLGISPHYLEVNLRGENPYFKLLPHGLGSWRAAMAEFAMIRLSIGRVVQGLSDRIRLYP